MFSSVKCRTGCSDRTPPGVLPLTQPPLFAMHVLLVVFALYVCMSGVWVCSAFVVVGSACNSVARVVREVPPGRLPPSQPGLSLTWAWKFTYAAERRALFLRQLVFAKPGMLYRPNQLGNTRYNLIICVCLLEYIIITVDSVIQLIWFSVKWHTRITHN